MEKYCEEMIEFLERGQFPIYPDERQIIKEFIMTYSSYRESGRAGLQALLDMMERNGVKQ